MPSQSKTSAVHKALRASEQQFQLLVQGVKDYAIFMLDPQGRITTWNSGAERIKGYRAEEIIGEHFAAGQQPRCPCPPEARRCVFLASRATGD
jgi:PAS domain-containing protein